VRFQTLVRDDRHTIGAFCRRFGCLEGGNGVALRRGLTRVEVAFQVTGRRLLLRVLQHFFFADDVIENFVLDLDRVEGVEGVFLGVRGDRGDLIA
jgi:hypothetical protein